VLAALAAAAALLAPATAADAKPTRTYYFLLHDIQLAAGVPAELVGPTRKQIEAELARRPEIATVLPEGAPDAKRAPDELKKFLARHKMRAFRVNVEITAYQRDLEPMPDGRSGQRLRVHVALRMFGETIPERVMAFAGDGSATVKIDVGKQIRPRDGEVANRDALELAVKDAVDESLFKLSQPPPTDKKAPKQRKPKPTSAP
jgi:hypothetical protein